MKYYICPLVVIKGKCPYNEDEDCVHFHPHDLLDECLEDNMWCPNCIIEIDEEFVKVKEMEL